jgi:guanylate kinase
MAGQLFVISAPSGAGKSTIIRRLRERVQDLGYSVSHTTRQPRPDEQNGTHYHFVDVGTFLSMKERGEFAEWAQVYGDFYGTSRASLHQQTASDRDMLLDLDVQGAKNIKDSDEESVLIYVLPPSLSVLERRLRERGTDEEDVIQRRLQKAREEIRHCAFYDHIIINDSLERAVGEAEAVIRSERSRTERRLPTVGELFGIPDSAGRPTE